MSIALRPSLLTASLLLGATLPVHADVRALKTVEPAPMVAMASSPVRGAVLTQVHTAFADGERIGTLHSGTHCRPEAERTWSPLVRQRVQAELARVFDAELARAGGSLAAGGEAPLRVQAFLNDMDVQLCQHAAGAWQGGFYVQVSWQIVSPSSGQVLYQASTEGSFKLDQPQRMSTAAGLDQAMSVAVRKLLADRRFTAMLQTGDMRRVASRS
jgi:hypothetical protein